MKTSYCQYSPIIIEFNHLSIPKNIVSKLLKHTRFSNIKELEKIINHCPLKQYPGLVYRWAIAFPLANTLKSSPQEVAGELLICLREGVIESDLVLEFNISVAEDGLIDFHLKDTSLGLWLHMAVTSYQSCSCQAWPEQAVTSHQLSALEERDRPGSCYTSENLFPVQYAHARCCSLLSLAEESGLIELTERNFRGKVWPWNKPNPVPGRPFLLTHPPENNLIAQLFLIVDALECAKEVDWVKGAISLSNTWEEFYRKSPIWGEVELELAQGRLALMALTEYFLRRLLKDWIGVAPLGEL